MDTNSKEGGKMMKRIANDIALQTILYLIGGLQKIRVFDYKNEYEISVGGARTEVFSGQYKDTNLDTFNYKQLHAKVRKIMPSGDELVIGICTAADTF